MADVNDFGMGQQQTKTMFGETYVTNVDVTPRTTSLDGGGGSLFKGQENFVSEDTGSSVSASDGASSGAGQAAGIMGIGQGVASLIGTGGSIATGIIGAQTAKIKAQAALDARRFNAAQARRAAEQTKVLARQQATDMIKNVGMLKGKQKAGFSGQGVKVGTGVASEADRVTDERAREMAGRIMANAGRDALGYQNSAANQEYAGAIESSNYAVEAASSLLGGAARGASSAMAGAYRLARSV